MKQWEFAWAVESAAQRLDPTTKLSGVSLAARPLERHFRRLVGRETQEPGRLHSAR